MKKAKTDRHKKWEDLKVMDPDKYRQLSRKAISTKLNMILPKLYEWFSRGNMFPKYENSLPDIRERLSNLNFDLYDEGLEGKIALTNLYIETCLGYDFESLMNVVESFEDDIQWKIKNLICHSYRHWRDLRNSAISNIVEYGSLNNQECQELPLLHYIPIKNHILGIEWINENIKKWKTKRILKSWIILLCIDENLFSSASFMDELKTILGKNRFYEVLDLLFNEIRRKSISEKLVHNFKLKYPNLIKLSSSASVSIQNTPQINQSNDAQPQNIISLNSTPPKNEFNAEEYLEKKIISRNVQASEFKIHKGYIAYKDYYLKSKRILRFATPSILSKINHTFTLIKDQAVVLLGEKDEVEKRFLFHPSNDLSFLLAEIERLIEGKSYTNNSDFPHEGIFNLPWKYVTFYDGIMYLNHPNPSKRATIDPFSFRHSDLKMSFRDLMPYIIERCPLLEVRAIDGRIEDLLNFEEFRKQIKHVNDNSSPNVVDSLIGKIGNIRRAYTADTLRKNSEIIKSPYLNHLCRIQIADKYIYSVAESANHESSYLDCEEHGYLFTIKQSNSSTTVLYENATDSSRSSLVFKIDTSKYDEGIRAISDFLVSEIKNKRQKLSYRRIKFNNPAVISYGRIIHNSFYDWKFSLLKCL